MCKNSHFQLHKCLLYLFVDYFDFPLWGYDYEIVIHLDSLLWKSLCLYTEKKVT